VTELERARQHLCQRQDGLRRARAMGIRPGELIDSAMRRIEADYLAALSWVWDAQERERAVQLDGVLISVVRVQRRPVIGYGDGYPYHGARPVPTYVAPSQT
jgi:hypothetical protein